jgi:hypothetical protein
MNQISENEEFISKHLGYGCNFVGNHGSEDPNRIMVETPNNGDFISNHSGYDYAGSENFEHDDTGGSMNYSGCYDQVMDAFVTNEGWLEGYDY